MYADESRIKDLAHLKDILKDLSVPMAQKKKYRLTITRIHKQLYDKQLALMRERLKKAHIASDRLEIWKISNQIKDYMGEETLEKETMV